MAITSPIIIAPPPLISFRPNRPHELYGVGQIAWQGITAISNLLQPPQAQITFTGIANIPFNSIETVCIDNLHCRVPIIVSSGDGIWRRICPPLTIRTFQYFGSSASLIFTAPLNTMKFDITRYTVANFQMDVDEPWGNTRASTATSLLGIAGTSVCGEGSFSTEIDLTVLPTTDTLFTGDGLVSQLNVFVSAVIISGTVLSNGLLQVELDGITNGTQNEAFAAFVSGSTVDYMPLIKLAPPDVLFASGGLKITVSSPSGNTFTSGTLWVRGVAQ